LGEDSFGTGLAWGMMAMNDLSLKLDRFSSGVCGHGSCLEPVSWEEESGVG
jgi:hypothetical protein